MGRLARLTALALLMALCCGKGLAATAIAPERVARAREAMGDMPLGRYGMVPIYARDVAEGRYPVHVASTSPSFGASEAELIVADGRMRLDFVISGDSCDYVWPGGADGAGSAGEGAWIAGELEDGGTRFSLPVPALNAPFDCAEHDRQRDRWYDRQLLIDAADLPEGALAFPLPDYELIEGAVARLDAGEGTGAGASEDTVANFPADASSEGVATDFPADASSEGVATDSLADASSEGVATDSPGAAASPRAAEIDLPDGEYAIEVNLAGGSGRAGVSSPTLLIVRDGRAWARLLWSSPHYDYMRVGGTTFYNLSADGGNSAFEIPILMLDAPVEVVADTTAMGEPVEIEYALTFYRDSVGDRSQIPQEAARRVLILSACVIAVGGVLNALVKRRRR